MSFSRRGHRGLNDADLPSLDCQLLEDRSVILSLSMSLYLRVDTLYLDTLYLLECLYQDSMNPG